jgi:hypothetical protein
VSRRGEADEVEGLGSMKRKPDFITFTGVDDWTSITEMASLSDQYPVEWGVLLSATRQGKDPRYPGGDTQSKLLWSNLRLSAHLCGSYARSIVETGSIDDMHIPVDLGYFRRIQINHSHPIPKMINKFHLGWGPRCIAQCREEFPKDTSIDWLFDQSGGRGLEPATFPPYPGRLVGYAGGIGPSNVLDVIDSIAATGPYWLDMESHVRINDRFSVALCRQVCEFVYGD